MPVQGATSTVTPPLLRPHPLPTPVAAMSSYTSSSASSLRSDGRKRKDFPTEPPSAVFKRFRRGSLYLSSLSTGCISSRYSRGEVSGELRFDQDPDPVSDADAEPTASVSCVEDAPAASGSFLSELLTGEASCGTASFLDSTGGGTDGKSYTFESTGATTSELQESAGSFDPGIGGPSRRRASEMAGLGGGSRFLAIKRRKFVTETTVFSGRELKTATLGGGKLDVTAMVRAEEGGAYHRAEIRSSTEVQVAAVVSQDDQVAPAPVYVLSSGRISRAQEEALLGGGGRPPTVDDEFDQYFSQLML